MFLLNGCAWSIQLLCRRFSTKSDRFISYSVNFASFISLIIYIYVKYLN